jgi:hypothetical protein
MKRKNANRLLKEVIKRAKAASKDESNLMGHYTKSIRLILDRIDNEYCEPRGFKGN